MSADRRSGAGRATFDFLAKLDDARLDLLAHGSIDDYCQVTVRHGPLSLIHTSLSRQQAGEVAARAAARGHVVEVRLPDGEPS